MIKAHLFSLFLTLTVVVQTNGQTQHLLGKITKTDLKAEDHNIWFSKNYSNYKPNTTITKALQPIVKDYNIKLFMGTWCGDSKKEVPRLFKVLEVCNFPLDQLEVIAVSKDPSLYKQSPQHEEEGLNIHRVPTVIFYKNGKEINRIVEHPITTFEEDIQNIVNKNAYKHNYQLVSAVDAILKNRGVKSLKRKQKRLIKNYKATTKNMYELNTYGKVLYSKNKTAAAIAVFQLNTQLFPENPKTYMSLANTLGVNKQKKAAIEVLKKAIKQHPDHKDLKENLKVIMAHTK